MRDEEILGICCMGKGERSANKETAEQAANVGITLRECGVTPGILNLRIGPDSFLSWGCPGPCMAFNSIPGTWPLPPGCQ